MKKTLMKIGAVLVTALLIVSFMVFMPVGQVEGSPAMSIQVILGEADGNGAISGEVTTDRTVEQSIWGKAVPLTTYTADIIGIEPNTQYELEFIITFQGDLPEGAPTGLELFGDVSIRGHHEPPSRFFYNSIIYGDPTDTSQLYPNSVNDIILDSDYKGTASFSKADNLHFDKMYDVVPNTNTKIPGIYIDNSIWSVTITTGTSYAGTDAYWGQTTAVITLNVNAEGNVDITLTDVTFTAGEV